MKRVGVRKKEKKKVRKSRRGGLWETKRMKKKMDGRERRRS